VSGSRRTKKIRWRILVLVEICTADFVVAVRGDAPIRELVSTMEQHQVTRVPVVDVSGCCVGIISQTDVASVARAGQVGELVREVSSTSAFSARSAALDSRHRRR
jgi:CBS-domain-containing membrane protein